MVKTSSVGRWILSFVGVVMVGLFLSGCVSFFPPSSSHDIVNTTHRPLRVVVSIYPLAEFSQGVGGDRVSVSILIPPGVEPHHYEPTPADIQKLRDADIIIFNGAGMEHPWGERLLESISPSSALFVDASEGVSLLSSSSTSDHSHSHDHAHTTTHTSHHHSHDVDPHTWLSPVIAQRQVENIRDAFIRKDPQGKDVYEKNAAEYIAQLQELDAAYRAFFATCPNRTIAITHQTLGYFCHTYGCEQLPLSGILHEAEQSVSERAHLIENLRKKNVTAIFVESHTHDADARAVAEELGIKVIKFHTIHTLTPAQTQQGASYLSLMRENIRALREGLGCP